MLTLTGVVLRVRAAGMDVLFSQPAMTIRCVRAPPPPYVKVLTRTDSVIMSSLAFLGLEDAAARSGSRAPARAHAQALRVSGSAVADPDPESGGYSSSDGNGYGNGGGNGGGSGVMSTHIPIHLS